MSGAICAVTAPLAAEWDALADEVGAAPFLRPGWFDAWYEAFAESAPRVYCVRRSGRLIGVLPMIGNRTMRSPTNAHTPFFDVLAADAGAADELAAFLTSGRPRRIVLELCNTDVTTTAAFVDGIRARGYHVVAEVMRSLPYIEAGRPWAHYEKQVGTKLRSDLRRQRRRLEDEGDVSIDVTVGMDGLDDRLAECFRMEASGWKGRRGTAIESDPRTRAFYTRIAHWLADQGSLELCILRLDGRAIAFEFNIRGTEVYYGFKSGYDDAFRRFGPGKLLLVEMIRGAFDRDLRYDFLGDADEYKLRWCDATEPRLRVVSFAPTMSGRLERAAFTYGVPLLRSVRRRLTGSRSGKPSA